MRAAKRRADLEMITAGGGVLFRTRNNRKELLLIKRNGVWDLPKGKLESNESVEDCAAREVGEETGITRPSVISHLCDTYHGYIENGKQIGKTTHWYSMVSEGDHDMKPQYDEGITELIWSDPDAALEAVGFDNLRKVITAFMKSEEGC
jgi:8-oxo-dGTP pyrophosphatase MutT (NUDIX family)